MKFISRQLHINQVVSIRYEDVTECAPHVDIVAAGLSEVQEVLALAKKYNIPIIEDPELARALSTCDEDTEIPSSLYRAVAVVLHQLRSCLPA